MEQAASGLMWRFNDYWSVTPNKEHLPNDLLHPPPQTHIFFSSSFSYKIRFSESWLGHCRLVICHIMGSLKARENEIHLRSKAEGLGRLALLSSLCPKHLGLKEKRVWVPFILV